MMAAQIVISQLDGEDVVISDATKVEIHNDWIEIHHVPYIE